MVVMCGIPSYGCMVCHVIVMISLGVILNGVAVVVVVHVSTLHLAKRMG